jgi:hypothetical protein
VIKWSYQEGNEERCAAWFMRENKRREGLFHLLPFLHLGNGIMENEKGAYEVN